MYGTRGSTTSGLKEERQLQQVQQMNASTHIKA